MRLIAVLALLLAIPFASHIIHSGTAPVPERPPGMLRIASANVHYIALRQDSGPWSPAGWAERRPAMAAALRALDADVIAFQEMESFGGGSVSDVNLARDDLLADLPGYALAGSGDPAEFPSTQPFFYRPEKLRPVDQGWFFFSETPDVIYSRTFNGSWPAFASWVEFETPAGQRLRLVNVHFEYRSMSNRRLSAALVAERIAPVIKAGTPLLLVGDLNAMHGAKTLRILEGAGLRFAPIHGATYHLNRGINLFGAIDHFATTPGIEIANPYVMRQKTGPVWGADHYPLSLDIRLPQP